MIIAGNAICLLSVLGFTSVALIPIHTIFIAYNTSQYTMLLSMLIKQLPTAYRAEGVVHSLFYAVYICFYTFRFYNEHCAIL